MIYSPLFSSFRPLGCTYVISMSLGTAATLLVD